jgi:hypothetical protein
MNSLTSKGLRGLPQENANRPEGLAPSQGGKFVGFGSSPPPAARRAGSGNLAVDDVTQMLSKGLSQLGTVAGTTALCPVLSVFLCPAIDA